MPALNREVKEAILRYVQNWSYAFEGKLSLSYVEQVYKTLKVEGRVSDAIIAAGFLSDGDIQASPSRQGTSQWAHQPWLTPKLLLNG